MNLIRSYNTSETMKQQPPHLQVSVISRNFCLRHSTDLLITKDIWQIGQGNSVVRNSNNGKIMFKIEASIFSFDRKRVMFDAAGAPIATLRKKAFSVVTTWQVYRGEGKNEKDLIFSVRRSSIFQIKTKLVVLIKGKKKLEGVCNYTVEGSWFERSCQVYVEDSSTILAQMQKNSSVNSLFSGKERFKVTVYPNVDCAFIAALIIILDEIVSETRRRSNNKRKH